MAELTMPMTEVVLVLKTTLTTASDKIKEIALVDRNKIKIIISISKLFPDIPVTLAYHSFNRGTLKFEVATNYPMKVIQTLINNIQLEEIDSDSLTLNDNILSVNIKDILKYSINWLEIKDVRMRNNHLTFMLSPVPN
jgi:hypothetical protein